MKYPKIRWTYELSNGEYFDGIPFAIIGIKKQDCQYGRNYNATKVSLRLQFLETYMFGWTK